MTKYIVLIESVVYETYLMKYFENNVTKCMCVVSSLVVCLITTVVNNMEE